MAEADSIAPSRRDPLTSIDRPSSPNRAFLSPNPTSAVGAGYREPAIARRHGRDDGMDCPSDAYEVS